MKHFGWIFLLVQFSGVEEAYSDSSPRVESITLITTEEENLVMCESGDPCDTLLGGAVFGYPPERNPPTSNFGARHKDVLGMWFVAPDSGTIDSLYWYMGSVGSFDSTITIRIFESNITPERGPGSDPYPLPCLPWGYYRDTNDLDQGITPFSDQATDSEWISSYSGDTATFDPIGREIWIPGGVRIVAKPHSINGISLCSEGMALRVRQGDVFFVTMRVNSPAGHIEDNRTEWFASRKNVPYPSRAWKFYEHDSGPTPRCGNYNSWQVPRGWVARGVTDYDPQSSLAFNWWYVLTPEPRTTPVVVGDATKDPLVARFQLEQNYPNPFNPVTEIRFEVPVSGFVSLKVYDVLGREVATLIDEMRDAGYGQVQWDAGGLPSGVYVVKMQAAGFVATKKIILIK